MSNPNPNPNPNPNLLLQGGEVCVEALGVHAALRAVAARRVRVGEGDGAHPMGHLVRVRLRVRLTPRVSLGCVPIGHTRTRFLPRIWSGLG